MRKIKSLKDVKRYLPNGYHEVCIEISGICNAKCKYCPSGNEKNAEKRGMMSVETFEAIVQKLIQNGIIGSESQIDLFWWGEPFLNSELSKIIEITQKYKIPYVLSTNAYYYRKLTKDDLKNIKRFIISIPGFSQESYDRIHGFDFEIIKQNIKKYVNDLDDAGKLDKIWLAYHIYQFNLDEIYLAYSFCNNLGISFNPGFAFPLLVEDRINYAKGSLELNREHEILKDIVTAQLDNMIKNSDRSSCIYQTRNFVIDEKGKIYGCLNMKHDTENYCGDLFLDSMDDIIENIAKCPKCDECVACGVAPTDMSFRFFWDDWFQMMKLRIFYENILKSENKNNCIEKAKVMLCLRISEGKTKDEQKKCFSDILNIMREQNLSFDEIRELINSYAMRQETLYKDFCEFLEEENCDI